MHRISQKFIDGYGNILIKNAKRSYDGRYICEGTKQDNVKFTAHADVYIAGNVMRGALNDHYKYLLRIYFKTTYQHFYPFF